MATFQIIKNLFVRNSGMSYIGENVSVVSHLIKAGETAKQKNYDAEVVVASLLHDCGHFLAKDNTNGYGVCDHARLGASFIRGIGLTERIARSVELHANAKRYLVTQDSDYYNSLSFASRVTLKYQGGIMNQDEYLDFTDDPYHRDALKVRESDDGSKTINLTARQAELSLYKFENLINTYSNLYCQPDDLNGCRAPLCANG